MSFHSPHILWALVPLGLLFGFELFRHSTRAVANWPKIARAWAGAFDVSLGARHSTAEDRPRLWLWLGLALCIVALARPQWGVVEEQVFDQSREVLIAVDLSRSMLAQDVKPSRLDRSKLLINSLLDELRGERVGLVLFAGTAFLQAPLSSDYEVLREFLPALTPDYLPEGGSNYKAMLETAVSSFGTSTADRYLIVLSDGESTVDDWKDLSATLKTKGIRVIGLGVGTNQGSFIPETGGGFVKDERGAVVMSRLNSSTLQELAQISGGAYTDASAWVDLAGLLRKTVEAGRKGEFSEKNTARLIERFQWFLAPGLLLLLISFGTEFPVRPRERALPLGQAKADRRAAKGQALHAAAWFLAFALALGFSPPAVGVEPAAPQEDALAKPLSTTIARLSAKDAVTPKEYSEMAQATITYGQRMKAGQQRAAETVVRDALQAVDLGEQQDAKAADWPRLRQELQDLLKKEEPPKDDKKNQDKQDQQRQNQQQNQDQQNQDQKQQDQKSEQQKQQEQSEQQKQQQQQNQDAFGDMKEKADQKPPEPKPQSGMQKVGGQKEEKPPEPVDAELAMPLQKLEQVRNQDSPAKLQQLMQAKPEKPKTTGKNW
jgi:Ca-activated chloride channel family protein